MRLIIQQQFTHEEYEIIKIAHQVLDKTKDSSIYYWTETIKSKKLAVVLHHLLFSCRDFLGSIFTLMHDCGYHSAYVIGAALVEYFIDFAFILKHRKLADSRSKEYFNATKKDKEPFSSDKKFKRIKQRATEAGLDDLYSKTYKSLCSFKHVNLRGHLVTRRDNKLEKDRKKFILQMTNLYLEMWYKLKDYTNNDFPSSINDILSNEFIQIEKLESQWHNAGLQ